MAASYESRIDENLNNNNPVSMYVDGGRLAQAPPHGNNVITAQAVPESDDTNFSVAVEVAVRGITGTLRFTTLHVLTPAQPVVSFPYSTGVVYRMNYTGGTGTVLARMRG